MASLGHVALGLAAARFADGRLVTARLGPSMVAWSLLSLLPDADVIGFAFGVRYGDPWGHRGATHALAIALAGGLVAFALARIWAQRRPLALGLLVAAVLASHGLLDTLTDGGRGVALAWPLSLERYFAPWRPIPVAPIGLGFLSKRGLYCAAIELAMFLPFWAWALYPRATSRSQAPHRR